jgi:hypothetical protein
LNCGIGTAVVLRQGGGPAADGPRNKSASPIEGAAQFIKTIDPPAFRTQLKGEKNESGETARAGRNGD